MRFEILGGGANSFNDADDDEVEELAAKRQVQRDEESDDSAEDESEAVPSPPKLKLNTF